MNLSALALDYDGTIAIDGVLDPAVRGALDEARQGGVLVILVTGRRMSDLRTVAGDLTCFDAIVAENGAIVEFPAQQQRIVIGRPPHPAFVQELRRRGVPLAAGECVIEAEAQWAGVILEVIQRTEQPLALAFNRGRLMILPQGIAKATGLQRALFSLRRTLHNTIGIGDAENDHDLLNACEVGVAVGWGSPALRAIADEVIDGRGPAAVADYITRVVRQPRLATPDMVRRRLMLGHERGGDELEIAVRGRAILIAGEPGTGKSWLAGLVCEQSILQGYCLCIIDPEGDYRTLEALPGVVVLGGEDPLPPASLVRRGLRHPDASVVLDLSQLGQRQKREYVRTLLPILAALRRETGLPHGIVLDEAHQFLSGPDAMQLIDPDVAGYMFVTYRVSMLPEPVRQAGDAVVMVTRELDPGEVGALLGMCRPAGGAAVSPEVFCQLTTSEAVLLPGAKESQGRVRRFRMGRRLTSHVRHRSKYLEMPVLEGEAFVFTDQGRRGPSARTLRELTALLSSLPAGQLVGHLQRHDFSRWVAGVFRDPELAAELLAAEQRADAENPRKTAEEIAHAISARYEPSPAGPPARP